MYLETAREIDVNGAKEIKQMAVGFRKSISAFRCHFLSSPYRNLNLQGEANIDEDEDMDGEDLEEADEEEEEEGAPG